MQIIPTIGSAGSFSVKDPFTLVTNKAYRCDAVATIASLKGMGVDVYTNYYVPRGLDNVAYESDVDAKASIVTLVPSDGITVYVPSTYITMTPSVQVVPYSNVVAAVELGMLPDDFNIDILLTEIKEFADGFTGTESTALSYRLPIDGFVDAETHVTLENARNASKLYSPPVDSRYRSSLDRIDELNTKIHNLEQIIIKLA